MDVPKLSGDTKLDGKIVEGHLHQQQTKIDRGAVGHLLGSSNSIPRNVAAIIALVSSLAVIIAVFRWAGTEQFGHKEGLAALSSLATLTIGFLFGRSSKE